MGILNIEVPITFKKHLKNEEHDYNLYNNSNVPDLLLWTGV